METLPLPLPLCVLQSISKPKLCSSHGVYDFGIANCGMLLVAASEGIIITECASKLGSRTERTQ